MGAADNEQHEKRDNRRAKTKAARGRRASAREGVDWEAADWGRIVILVAELSRLGGALRLGVTRDGGAYALGVYLGDDYATEYIRPSEDFATAVDEIASAWMPDQGARYFRLIEEATPPG